MWDISVEWWILYGLLTLLVIVVWLTVSEVLHTLDRFTSALTEDLENITRQLERIDLGVRGL